MNEIEKLIKQDAELARKHEEIRSGILNDPELPQEFKDKMNDLKTEFEMKWSEEDKSISDNIKIGKKIVGYDKETFLPIFE